MIIETGLSAVILASYYFATRWVGRWLTGLGEQKKAAPQRAVYIAKVFDFGLAVLVAWAPCLVWEVDDSSVLLFVSSIVAVLGAVFFTQWSILSNITASTVIFFTYRRASETGCAC